MMMHKALHLKDDKKNKFYVSRKDGARGFASIEDTVDASIRRRGDYIEKRKEGLITAIRNNTNSKRINQTAITRKHK